MKDRQLDTVDIKLPLRSTSNVGKIIWGRETNA